MLYTHPAWPGSDSTEPAPARSRSFRRTLVGLLTALIAVPISVVSSSSPAVADTSQFRGVNWARPGDNFVNGPVIPEGLGLSDSYATVRAKADAIYSGFQNTLGANTARLPINTYSVPGTTWGNAYIGAIDAAVAKGFKVVLSYWEDGASSGGRIINMAAFNSMWNAVTAKYGSNSQIYFEPMNEPHGYNATDWANIAATWITNHPAIPRNRIFVSGIGYNGDVKPVCADSRLNGTYLSYHHYAFMSGAKNYDQWVAHFKSGIGSCGWRTVLDEFGSPMDDGLNYNDASSTDNFVRYLRADTDTVRSLGMGAIYWPALGGKHQERPTYDYYSLFALQGSGTNLTLRTRNVSGLDRLKYAWGNGPGTTSVLRNVGANSCLDVPGATHANVDVLVYACNNQDNQKWTRSSSSGQITVYGGEKCLEAVGEATANGTAVGIYDCTGRDNQKWTVNSDGTIRGVQSGSCLDVELSTSRVVLWSCHGGTNQRWQTA